MATFGSATLVLKGPKGSTTVEVSGHRVTVGRDSSSDYIVHDPSVSNTHCELVKEDGALVIRDLSSSNGTYVNGKRVQSQKLYDGDVVHIGQSQGGIAVRQQNGHPLQPPGQGSGVTVVMTVLALLFFAAGGGLFWLIHQRTAERDGFAQFEHQAQEAMQGQSPCDTARDPLVQLGLGADLVLPPIAKPGKLSTSELDSHRALLKKTLARQQTIERLLGNLKERAESQERKDQLRQLIDWKGRFNDPALRAAVEQVQHGLEQQVEDGVKFMNGLDEYAKALARFNERLTKVTTTEERGPSDLDAPPDGRKPVDLLRTCEQSFDETTSDAFKKLASIPL